MIGMCNPDGSFSVADPPHYAGVTIFISDECGRKKEKIGGDNLISSYSH
jgi:hypothetical protein